jgi:hypothetical protein
MVIGVYGAIGQTLEGTHGIIGKGEVSCLKCHYGKYEEMVSTGHGQDFVENVAKLYYNSGSEDDVFDRDDGREAMESNAETYACLLCHMKRDRFDRFGAQDLVVWKENSAANNYPDELWALIAGVIPFPFGPGYTSPTATGVTTNSSDITLYVNGTATATSVNATFTFFDANGNNNDTTVVLTQVGSDFYGGVTEIYPDYFSVSLISDTNESPDMYIISDGEYVGVYEDSLTADTARTLRGTRIYTPGTDASATYVRNAAYANSWNFHTGDYGVITRMTEVWEMIRTYNVTEFPRRGNPIDYLGTVGEGQSCSSTRGLCHNTLQILDQVQNERAIRNTMAAVGYEYYYKHTMTLSTASEAICGTCHAPLFAEGYSAHEGVQCYDCHSAHPMPAGSE